MVATHTGRSPVQLRSAPLPNLDGAQFAPTGGSRIQVGALLALRSKLDEILDDVGFPESTLPARQRFDREVMVHLGELSWPPGEMLRAEVWAWIAVRLVPHAIAWRFMGRDGSVTMERFAGSIHRNALGRLWLRSWVLDDRGTADRWSLATALTEDAAVALLERASLAADHRLARAIVRCWIDLQRSGVPDLEGLLRGAMKRIRVMVAMLEPLAMSDDATNQLVHSAFSKEHVARLQSRREVPRDGLEVDAPPATGETHGA